MKKFFIILIYCLIYPQQNNQSFLMNHTWQLYYVQNNGQEPVYATENSNYNLTTIEQNNVTYFKLNVCNDHFIYYNSLANSSFSVADYYATLMLCENQNYPDNITVIDSFVSGFFQNVYTNAEIVSYNIITLSDNNYQLEIYNPTNHKLVFNFSPQISAQNLFVTQAWQLNFVQNNGELPVYADENTIYNLEILTTNGIDYYMLLNLYSGMSVNFNFNDNNSFSTSDSSCLCAGPPCEQLSNPPINHCFIDGFYVNFYATPNQNYTYSITNLGNNLYSLDIYNANQQRLNFKNTNLSLSHFKSHEANVYPNPAKDIVAISSNFDIESFILYNLMGNQIQQQKFSTKIYITHLPKGVYFLTLKGKQNELLIKKIIKQ